MELIGGYLTEHFGQDSLIYKMETTVEESLEMLGIILFARTLVQYLNMLPERTDILLNFNKGISHNGVAIPEQQPERKTPVKAAG